VDVVLVEPQKSENIGACARAMANTGLGRLVLVRPRVSRPELMEAAATRLGEGILRSARICRSLPEALAPYPVTAAATARAGAQRGSPVSPRALAEELLRPAPGGNDPPPAALVFGTERDGLSNADLRLCALAVTIPTHSPEESSLNLAQAVLLLGYELLLAAGGEPPQPLPVLPAPAEDFERAAGDLERVLYEIGFLPERDPGRWFMNVKKILRRSGLTRGECDLIQGICRQIRWAAGNGLPPGRAPWPGGGAPAKAAEETGPENAPLPEPAGGRERGQDKEPASCRPGTGRGKGAEAGNGPEGGG
jgi:tRNA/rRNA methyltransferase